MAIFQMVGVDLKMKGPPTVLQFILEEHECSYQMTLPSIQYLLRYISLDQSKGLTDWH